MGRQSARIYFNGQDHKEMVTWDGTQYVYHDKAYIWNGSEFELVWEKLDDDLEGIVITSMYNPNFSITNFGISNDKKYLYYRNAEQSQLTNNIFRTAIKDLEDWRYGDPIPQPSVYVTKPGTIISGLLVHGSYIISEYDEEARRYNYYAGADLYDLDNKVTIFENAKTSEAGQVEPPHSLSDVQSFSLNDYDSIRIQQDLVKITPASANAQTIFSNGFTVWMHTNSATPSRASFIENTLTTFNHSQIVGMLSTTRGAWWRVSNINQPATTLTEYIDVYNTLGGLHKEFELNPKARVVYRQWNRGAFNGNRYLAYVSENYKLCIGSLTPDSLDIEEVDISCAQVKAVSPSGRYTLYKKTSGTSTPVYMYDKKKKQETKLRLLNSQGQYFDFTQLGTGVITMRSNKLITQTGSSYIFSIY